MAHDRFQGASEHVGEYQMTSLVLKSRTDVLEDMAHVFADSPQCRISIREDTAFKSSTFLPLGVITLCQRPGQPFARTKEAIDLGMFEWHTPTADEASIEINNCVDLGPNKSLPNHEISSILNILGSVAIRTHLRHPIFDAHALQTMPFKKPTTLVCDTSAILNGALNFTATYLIPAVRIKVPGIVHMELVNLADRFLKIRRSNPTGIKVLRLLTDHFLSQSGQRVLLQNELHSDVEIEHPFLLGNPLRSAFQKDDDKELQGMQVSVAITSYADRMILETARQHRLQATAGHKLLLLTSDQGLARMALAEGIDPLYFHSTNHDTFWGQHFTGVNYHPFREYLHSTSIPTILWDLATMAGTARLESTEGPERKLEVWATRSDLPWWPQHSREDLLWTGYYESIPTPRPNATDTNQSNPQVAGGDVELDGTGIPSRPRPMTNDPYRSSETNLLLLSFRVDRMIALIDELDTQQELSVASVLSTLGIRSVRAREYRRFLESGNAVSLRDDSWFATPVLRSIAVAVRGGNMQEVRESFRSLQVFRALETHFSKHEVGSEVSLELFGRAQTSYSALAEITGLGARVYGSGFFATPRTPNNAQFCNIAIETYNHLREASDWIPTGQWLECLVSKEGIHPETTRRKLQTCSELGLLKRITEGSTPQTAYDRHTLRVLDVARGTPLVRTVYLYRGDFLIPGKASSSIKLERID